MQPASIKDRFEDHWQAAIHNPAIASPRIRDFLSPDVIQQLTPEELETVLGDLITIDFENRWTQIRKHAEQPTGLFLEVQVPAPEDYLVVWHEFLPDLPLPPQLVATMENTSREMIAEAGNFMPQIPGYQMLEILGSGGTSIVLKAVRITDQRPVAVKILRQVHGLPDGRHRLRLQQEAKVLLELQHPQLTKAFAFNCHRGLWYLVEELHEGGSLERRLVEDIRRGSLPEIRDAASWIQQATEGIQYLHQKKIIHRDVTLANLLLTADGQIRVTDLGLCLRMPDSDLPQEVRAGRTASGTLLGTPIFLAPEQVGGSSAAGTVAVDIYGLGVCLYYLLAGRPPFIAGSLFEMLRLIVEDDPPPPARLHSDIPQDLQTICLKCIEKRAQWRYASAADLSADLQRFLNAQHIHAQPPGPIIRLARKARRYPWTTTLLSSLLLALVCVFFLLATGLASRSQSLRQLSEKQQQLEVALNRETSASRRARSSLSRQAFLEYQANRLENVRFLLTEMQRLKPDETRLWEWHYLSSLTQHHNRQSLSLNAPAAPWVTALAFSPSGKWLAAGSGVPPYNSSKSTTTADLKVWDTDSWTTRLDLSGKTLSIVQLLFTPDNNQLVALERDNGFFYDIGVFSGTARIRRFSTHTFEELPPIVTAPLAARIAFTPDGKLVVAEQNEIQKGRLLLFDLQNSITTAPAPEQIFDTWDEAANEPGFLPHSPNAPDSQTSELPARIPVAGQTLKWHTNGQYDVRSWCAASWTLEPDLERFSPLACRETRTGVLKHVIEVEGFETAALSGSEKLVAIASRRGEIQLRATDSWTRQLTLRGHTTHIRSLAFNPREELLCSGDWDGNIFVWNLLKPGEFHDVLPPLRGNDTAAFAVDHTGRILALTAGHPVRAVDASSDTPQPLFDVPFSVHVKAPGRMATFSQDASRLFTVNPVDTLIIEVHESTQGTLVRTLRHHSQPVRHLRATHQRLISTAWPSLPPAQRFTGLGELILQNHDGDVLFQHTEPGARFLRADLSSDHRWLAAAIELSQKDKPARNIVRIWDLQQQQPVQELTARSWVLGLVFSPHSSRLAAADFEYGDLLIHDAATGRTRHSFPAALPQAQDLCFLDGDARIAAASRFDFRLLDAEQGTEVLNHELITFPIDYIFNPQIVHDVSHRRLLVNQADGTIRILGPRDASP
ncbi:MAG: protein kinase domain-containing protein [Planctomycetota bacterium]